LRLIAANEDKGLRVDVDKVKEVVIAKALSIVFNRFVCVLK